MLRDHQLDRPRAEPEPVLPAEAQEAAREAGIVGAVLDLLDEQGFDSPSASWAASDTYRAVFKAWKELQAECQEYGIEIERRYLRSEMRP